MGMRRVRGCLVGVLLEALAVVVVLLILRWW
jgi:hypothetical protein